MGAGAEEGGEAALSPAEQAVIDHALARGFITRSQLNGLLQASSAGDAGVLHLLARALGPAQREELRAVHQRAQAGTLPPTHAGTLPPTHAGTLPPTHAGTLPPTHAGTLPLTHAGTFPPTRAGTLPPTDAGTLPPGQAGTLPPGERTVAASTLRASADTLRDRTELDAAPAARPRGSLPVRIGPYRIEGELGRGGMGVVYAGVHPELGRRVAIKTLPAAVGAGGGLVQRFLTEAQAAAQLRHPNVVAIHEVGVDEGRHFMALDLIEGEGLDARLEREGALEPREAARIALGMARGLEHAHAHGVLHRDLKPANVLLDVRGVAKLTDFGLAKRLGGEGLTRTGEIMGTPSYMPPEQARGESSRVDARADVYGVGATLYALLTGEPPFRGASAMAILAAVLKREVEPPSSRQPDVPAELEAICLQCLAKDPAQRYPGMDALAADLEAFLGPEAGRRVQARRPSRGPLPALAAATALLLGVGGVVGWALRAPGEDPGQPREPSGARSGGDPVATPAGPPVRAPRRLPEEPLLTPYRADAPLEGRGWVLVHGMGLERYRERHAELARRGLLPVSVYANSEAEPAAFSVVWREDARPHEVSLLPDRVTEVRRRMKAGRFRALVRTPFYLPRDELAYAEVYVRDGRGASEQFNRKGEFIAACDADLRAKGYTLQWLTGLRDRDFPVWGCWVHDPPAAATGLLRADRTALGFERDLLEQPGRLVHLARYGSRERPLYAAHFQNDGREAVLFHDQEPDAYQAAASLLTGEGYHPVFVLASGRGAGRWTSSWTRDPVREWTVRGRAVPELASLDETMRAFLAGEGISRAALAVTRGGRLVCARAYTHAPAGVEPTPLDARFRLGDASQALTALATLRLVEAGEVGLEQPLSELLPEFTARLRDEARETRAASITVAQLLGHRAGWDRPLDFLYPQPRRETIQLDVALLSAVGNEAAAEPPRTPAAALRLLGSFGLDAAPGTRFAPNPLGYLVLGRALDRVGKLPYEVFVDRRVLAPLGITRVSLGHSGIGERLADEVCYESAGRARDVRAGGVVPAAYGGFDLDLLDAAQGWVGSAPELARLLAALADPAGCPMLEAGTVERMWTPGAEGFGLGWWAEGEARDPHAWVEGRLSGSTARLERFPGGTGLVLLLNRDVETDALAAELHAQLSAVARWPEHDLFGE